MPSWLRPAFAGTWRRIAVSQLLLVLATGGSLVSSWLIGHAVDVDVAAGNPAGLLRAAGIYLALVVLGALVTWFARVDLEVVAQAAMLRLKERLFAHVVDHDLELHDEQGGGRLLARVTGDVEALRALSSAGLQQAPADVLLFVGHFVVLGATAPSLALVAAAALPLYGALLWWYRRVSPARFLASREVAASLAGFLVEHLRALPVLRSYGRLDWVRSRAHALGAEKAGVDLSASLAGVTFFNVLFGVRAIVLAATVWLGAVQVHDGTLTIGLLLVALDYARKMVEPFLRLQIHLTTVERARAGITRIDALLARTPKIRSPVVAAPWPARGGAVRFEGLRFAYVPGTPVLEDVSLDVPAGARVALVGPTGGGKTTVVQFLFRFRDPDAGRVTIDGIDVRAFDLGTLRERVGLVSQDVHVLPGTVAENLGVDEVAAIRLLAAVGLDRRLRPDSCVGDGGEALSRGEAQLLCVARALAADPDILVLDEATAAMDPLAEAALTRLIDARPGRTVITIAHRLSTVVDADQLVVIEAGRVVECGTHAELLAVGGVYAEAWQRQRAEGAA